MTLTLDANVWIAAYDRRDQFHATSIKFISAATQRLHSFVAPSLILVEVSCALARRTQSAEVGQSALQLLRSHPRLSLQPVSEDILLYAARLGSTHLLRGADALYAATAELTNTQLISWDKDLVRRASATTPSDWLIANP